MSHLRLRIRGWGNPWFSVHEILCIRWRDIGSMRKKNIQSEKAVVIQHINKRFITYLLLNSQILGWPMWTHGESQKDKPVVMYSKRVWLAWRPLSCVCQRWWWILTKSEATIFPAQSTTYVWADWAGGEGAMWCEIWVILSSSISNESPCRGVTWSFGCPEGTWMVPIWIKIEKDIFDSKYTGLMHEGTTCNMFVISTF